MSTFVYAKQLKEQVLHKPLNAKPQKVVVLATLRLKHLAHHQLNRVNKSTMYLVSGKNLERREYRDGFLT